MKKTKNPADSKKNTTPKRMPEFEAFQTYLLLSYEDGGPMFKGLTQQQVLNGDW